MGLISKKELSHRLCNGFISHDGYVDGRFTDVFSDSGIELSEILDEESPYGKMMNLVIKIITSVPDVDPVKHAKWLYAEDYKDIGEIMKVLNARGKDPLDAWINTFYCSECCAQINAIDNCDADSFKYCPYCGAKMDKE